MRRESGGAMMIMLRRVCRRLLAAQLVAGACGLAADGAQPAAGFLADFTPPAKNYVLNGDFSAALGTGWKLFHQPTGGEACGLRSEGPDGGSCFKISGTFDESIYLQQLIMPNRTGLTTGSTYTLSLSLKAENVEGTDPGKLLYFVNHGWHQGSVPIGASGATTDGWEKRAVTFRAPPTTYPPDSYKYMLVLYWPKGTTGTVWIDNVQLEEGSTATPFEPLHTDSVLMAARDLKALHGKAEKTRKSIAEGFPDSKLARGLLDSCSATIRHIEQAAAVLATGALDVARLELLTRDLAAIRTEMGAFTCLIWTQNPYLPSDDTDFPERLDPPRRQELTCHVNETRNLGLMFTNTSGHSIEYRIAPQRFRRESSGTEIDGNTFTTIYEAPLIRGRLHQDRLFTDPLPQCNEMNHLSVPAGETRQALVSISTRGLDPDRYSGTILLDALNDRHAYGSSLELVIAVVGARLPDAVPVDVCPLGACDLRPEEAVRLGHNLMCLDGGAIPIHLDEHGNVSRAMDFTHLERQVRYCRAIVPNCKFVLLFSLGPRFMRLTHQLHGYTWPEDRLKRGWQNWLRELYGHFSAVGLTPADVYLQVVDEPQDSQIEVMAELSRLARQAVPGIKTMTYGGDPQRHRALFEVLDLACPTSKALAREGLVSRIRETGTKVGLYDCREYNEINIPLCYRRLMPWKVWKHGLSGWHYWSRDDRHPNWEAVKYMSVLYPLTDSEFGRALTPDIGVVPSRHWLALEAGYQDFKALHLLKQALARARSTGGEDSLLQTAQQFLTTAPERALALNHPTEFPTRLAPGADPDVPDRLREQMATLSAQLLQPHTVRLLTEPRLSKRGTLTFTTDQPCHFRVRYVVDGDLPRRVLDVTQPARKHRVDLPRHGGRGINRCRITIFAENGTVLTASPFIEGKVTVDSLNTHYGSSCITDGLRHPGALFWPGKTWVSSGEAVQHWVSLDWEASKAISKVSICWMARGGLPEAYKLQYRTAGTWQDLFPWRRASSAFDEVKFRPVHATGLRVVQKASGGGIHTPTLMGLSEIEVY